MAELIYYIITLSLVNLFSFHLQYVKMGVKY